MPKDAFIAVLTEYGCSREYAEKTWDKRDCSTLPLEQVHKVGAVCQAVGQFSRGEKIETPGIIVA